jgi:catechol 2,3-dioxygenase-like lactoylglutathione lyase family enzyme
MKAQTAMATVPVSDLGRAKKFYEDVLGLSGEAGAADDEWGAASYAFGDAHLFVYQTQAKSGDATVVSLRVEDLEQSMKELRDKGVAFEEYDLPGLKTENGIASWSDERYGEMRTAWFKDPDGNIMAIGEGPLP